MPGGKYHYFDFIVVLHIILYKIITTVGIYTKIFPACLKSATMNIFRIFLFSF